MWPNAKVSVMGSQQLSNVMTSVSKLVCLSCFDSGTYSHALSRDPAQHESLASKIEAESTAYYASARLWDDGIVRPTDTRDVLGLALALHSTRRQSGDEGPSTTWDGEGRGFGVFRM